MSSPSLCCVIPTLNSGRTLEFTLLSLQSQRAKTLEIVVVDSGSTDETLAICARYAVVPRYVAPGHMYRAINAGFASSGADWFYYLNSDDLLYPGSLSRLLAVGMTTEADVVYGDCDYVDTAGRFLHSFASARPDELLSLFRCRRMGFAQPASLFRRSVFLELKGFDESYRYRADADFFLRALATGKRFARCPTPPVACFRIHEGQFSNRERAGGDDEAKRLFGKPEDRPSLRDWMVTAAWHGRNLPHYALRVLRASLLSQGLRLPRSIQPPFLEQSQGGDQGDNQRRST